MQVSIDRDSISIFSASDTQRSVLISRSSGVPSLSVSPVTPSRNTFDVAAVAGIIKLNQPYLIVVQESATIGQLLSHTLFRVKKLRVIPIAQQSDPRDTAYLALLDEVVRLQGFYYSPTMDITNSVQRGSLLDTQVQRRDIRFHWNKILAQPLVDAGCGTFVVALTLGFAEIARIGGLTFALLSRRSCFRTGKRYTVRGLDESANAANFVETEQVVTDGQKLTSYMQIRGSIPLLWTQRVNLKYTPKGVVDPDVGKQFQLFSTHFAELKRQYNGPVLAISLINQDKGFEKTMSEHFSSHMKKISDNAARLVAFDFHKECAKMRYDRLSVLHSQVRPDMDAQGYTVFLPRATSGAAFSRTQNGVIRTNCIDCLDRTNVVQSTFARIILLEQLKNEFGQEGIASQGNALRPDFEAVFKRIWADNGDVISEQYSGTGAMKADFTRTGKRTIWGALDDGRKSLTRYYFNNFVDGARHDALELFLGAYQVDGSSKSSESPFSRRASAAFKRTIAFGVLFLLIASLGFTVLGLFTTPRADVEKIATALFISLSLIITTKAIQVYGGELVDRPGLHVLSRGPGHHAKLKEV